MKRPRPIGASASAQETISSYSHLYLSVVPVVITSLVLVMTVVIAVSIVIRMVIVLNTAVLSGPVARGKLHNGSFASGCLPTRRGIRILCDPCSGHLSCHRRKQRNHASVSPTSLCS